MTSPRRNRRVLVPAAEALEGILVEPGEERDPGEGRHERRQRAHFGRIVRPGNCRAHGFDGPSVGATTCPRSRRRPAETASRGSIPAMTAVPGRLRLTVLGCSTALPAPDAAAAGIPRRVRRHCHPPRRRAGCRQPARSSRGRARAGRGLHRAHARRPFPRPRRAPVPVPVGRSRVLAAARPSAAGWNQPARRAGLGDLRTSGLLRRRLRRRRVRPGRDLHRRSAEAPFRAGPPLRAGVGCLGRDARRGATGLHRGHGTQSVDGGIRPRRRRAPGRGDPQRRLGGRRRAGPPDGRGGDRPGTGRPGRVGTPCPLPAGSTARNWIACAPRQARGSGRPFLG